MAGTDSRNEVTTGGPAIVLVAPQLGENIGTAARAMLNCGLDDLRLVAPRDGWPNPDAVAPASGASTVLDRARLFPDTASAVSDLHHVYATSARPRDMAMRVLSPGRLARLLRQHDASGERSGVLFGPERTGLTNDDLLHAEAVVTVPLNPAFSSLNLAQAVLLVAHRWYDAGDDTPAETVPLAGSRPATAAELDRFFRHLEQELDASGFLRHHQLRPTMVRNIRNLFHRAGLREQEVQTLHGVVSALSGRRLGGAPVRRATADPAPKRPADEEP